MAACRTNRLWSVRHLKKTTKIMVAVLIAVVAVGIFILAVFAERNSQEEAVASDRVVINEIMASNRSVVADEQGSYADWIELYNPTDTPVDLAGFGLSNEEGQIKWLFPKIVMEPGGYILVFATSNAVVNVNAPYQHTGFKLSASGGVVVLTNSGGEAIDMVEFGTQQTNISLGRSSEDASVWVPFEAPTPGFSNDAAGAQSFAATRVAMDVDLLITEVMASNSTTYADNDGEYSDYIEIYNAGDTEVDLTGFALSDNPDNVTKWRFPEVTILPGEHIAVFASGKDAQSTDIENKQIHTSFRISAYAETIVLADPLGLSIDEVTISEAVTDSAYMRALDVSDNYTEDWALLDTPSPGFFNNESGYSLFEQNNNVAAGPVVITEVMVANNTYLAEEDGEFYDWIELHNQSGEAVDIGGYSLTDDTSFPTKWRFPQTVLAPGQFLTVLASGLADTESPDVKKKYMHTNFALSAAGEVLALYDANAQLQDRYRIRTMPNDVSVGRNEGENVLFYFEKPTPGQTNSSPSVGIVSTPQPSDDAGSYSGAQQIGFTSETMDAKIYYTLDGTVPTSDSSLYMDPLTLRETGIIRTRAYKDGYIDSAVGTYTFFIDEAHELPLISVVTDPDNLWDEQTGIYVLGPNPELVAGSTLHYEVANYLEGKKKSERPASFEVFDKSGGRVFEQDVAIRIQGGYSRDNQQKSLSVIARAEYGLGTLAYPFFEELPFEEYESLVLKNGGQDQWYAKIKGPVIQTLTNGKINCLVQTFKTYVVYLNGEYWGVYFLQEKHNEDFAALHENVEDSSTVNYLAGSGMSDDPRFLLNGTNEGYKEVYTYATTHDMSQKEHFDYVAERLDTDSFMDLMVNQVYIANSDYYNLQFYQVPDGKWKQVLYDFCWAFRLDHSTLTYRRDPKNGGSDMFNALLSYEPWKQAFIARMAWTMENIYTVDHFVDVIDEMTDAVAAEMPAERAKFTDYLRDWNIEVEELRTFAKERPANALLQLKSVFGLSGSQLREHFSFSDEELMRAFNLSESQMSSIFG